MMKKLLCIFKSPDSWKSPDYLDKLELGDKSITSTVSHLTTSCPRWPKERLAPVEGKHHHVCSLKHTFHLTFAKLSS